jgi:alpha-L-fucosidase 2
VGGDPEHDVTDASMWRGDRNAWLQGDGQFSYDASHFGSYNQSAHIRMVLPGHSMSAIRDFRRTLDLGDGL